MFDLVASLASLVLVGASSGDFELVKRGEDADPEALTRLTALTTPSSLDLPFLDAVRRLSVRVPHLLLASVAIDLIRYGGSDQEALPHPASPNHRGHNGGRDHHHHSRRCIDSPAILHLPSGRQGLLYGSSA